MSQLSLFLHILIGVFVLTIIDRGITAYVRKSDFPKWLSVTILSVTILGLLFVFWIFCGYLGEKI